MAAAQRTLRAPARVAGAAVHSGAAVSVTLRPAAADHGIRFVRQGSKPIPALIDFVSETMNRTALTGPDGAEVATVEHMLAACYAAGLDNVCVELDGPEAPILDGSGLGWLHAIESVGLVEQTAGRQVIRVLAPVEVRDGAKRAALLPAEAPSLTATIRFPDRVIGTQSLELPLSREIAAREIIPARTFGFLADLDRYRAMGLALGASLENTVAVTADGVANPEGLRFPDEFVRHKMLDVLGDLALAGAAIHARYEGDQPGHGLNAALVRALMSRPEAWVREADSAVAVGLAAG